MLHSQHLTPLKAKGLAEFSRKLEVMLHSGLTLVQTVHILYISEKNSGISDIYHRIYVYLLEGNDFSKALEELNPCFPPLLINLFRAGEAGGDLTHAAKEAADYYDREERFRKNVGSSLIYPVFLFGMTLVSLVVIFTAVLPSFFDLFDTIEELPAKTRIVMAVSWGLVHYGHLILLALLAVGVIGAYLCSRPEIRYLMDRAVLKLPLIGPVMEKICTARFARTLTALYSNGVPLVNALGIASSVINNRYIEAQFPEVLEEVCNGSSLSIALSAIKGFSPQLAANIFIGEECGELGGVLTRMADSFDEEATENAKRLTTLLEPVMIVVLAVIIGFIMLSVMTPVYQYYQNIGG